MITAGPGFIGTFQASIIWGLGLFHVDRNVALAYSLVNHALGASVTIGFGLWSLVGSHLSIGSLVKASQAEVAEAVEAAQ
jgi:uncharacterized membrane protein YbhN (UPF0104 family)